MPRSPNRITFMVAPHNPLGPLATLVNIHFAASTPNFFILEYHPDDESPRKDLVKGDTIVAKDGYLEIPDKPGWGYEMDEEAFKSMPPSRGGAPRHSGRMVLPISSKASGTDMQTARSRES